MDSDRITPSSGVPWKMVTRGANNYSCLHPNLINFDKYLLYIIIKQILRKLPHAHVSHLHACTDSADH